MAVNLKSLETLEDRIKQAMSLVTKLRDENREMRDQGRELKARIATLEGKLEDHASCGHAVETMKVSQHQLERELADLQAERETVLSRVDSLLEDLSKLDLD